MESIRESYQTFLKNRTPDNMPVNPSDHGILHLDLQVGNANIGVVSWNVMTQGLYRTEKHLAHQNGKTLRKPNDLIKPIHNRMPVVVPDGYEEAWTEHVKNSDELKGLIAMIMGRSKAIWTIEEINEKATTQINLF